MRGGNIFQSIPPGAEAPLFSSFYLFSVLFNPSHLETFSEKVPE